MRHKAIFTSALFEYTQITITLKGRNLEVHAAVFHHQSAYICRFLQTFTPANPLKGVRLLTVMGVFHVLTIGDHNRKYYIAVPQEL